jgi:hypothetical protein
MIAPRRLVRVAVLLIVPAVAARAQIRASERGSVSQTVNGTVITVDYGRPQIRGRDSVFGKVIPNDEVWTPGANLATTLQLSRDVEIQGTLVPTGKYSMWMTTAPGEWKLYLHKNAGLFHTQHPKLAEMTFTFPLRTSHGEQVEVLTFDFPRVSRDGTELRFRWAATVAPIDIKVFSPTAVTLSPEQVAAYVGSYVATSDGPDGKPQTTRFEIVNAHGTLRGVSDDPKAPMEMELIPTSTPHRFLPGFSRDGKLYDVETFPIVFDVKGGKAVGFQIGEGKDAWVHATRKP